MLGAQGKSGLNEGFQSVPCPHSGADQRWPSSYLLGSEILQGPSDEVLSMSKFKCWIKWVLSIGQFTYPGFWNNIKAHSGHDMLNYQRISEYIHIWLCSLWENSEFWLFSLDEGVSESTLFETGPYATEAAHQGAAENIGRSSRRSNVFSNSTALRKRLPARVTFMMPLRSLLYLSVVLDPGSASGSLGGAFAETKMPGPAPQRVWLN